MKILDARFIKTVAGLEGRGDEDIPEFSFIGRSNVGKSSLINGLAMRKVARTSSTPGATRAINLYKVSYEFKGSRGSVLFSDFPGFGYSKVSRSTYTAWQQIVERYIAENPWIKRLMWVFDVRRDPDRLDEMLIEWLADQRLDFTLVLTKIDKEGINFATTKKRIISRIFKNEAVFLYSAKDGYGRKELLSHILHLIS
jgi:GTP-binding protein